jgi:hypothetical protein
VLTRNIYSKERVEKRKRDAEKRIYDRDHNTPSGMRQRTVSVTFDRLHNLHRAPFRESQSLENCTKIDSSPRHAIKRMRQDNDFSVSKPMKRNNSELTSKRKKRRNVSDEVLSYSETTSGVHAIADLPAEVSTPVRELTRGHRVLDKIMETPHNLKRSSTSKRKLTFATSSNDESTAERIENEIEVHTPNCLEMDTPMNSEHNPGGDATRESGQTDTMRIRSRQPKKPRSER